MLTRCLRQGAYVLPVGSIDVLLLPGFYRRMQTRCLRQGAYVLPVVSIGIRISYRYGRTYTRLTLLHRELDLDNNYLSFWDLGV